MLISNLNYSQSRDKENGGLRFWHLLKLTVSGRAGIHVQAYLTATSAPSLLCSMLPIPSSEGNSWLLGPSKQTGLCHLPWFNTNIKSRAPVVTQVFSLYRSLFGLVGSYFLPVNA